MPALRDAHGRFISGGSSAPLGLRAEIDFTPGPLQAAVEKTAFRNFTHAAASISKDVKSTLESAAGPSSPGTPPHTHKGAFLRRAIRYAADRDGAVIGPAFSAAGTSGQAHEFGGDYKGEHFPERPFMFPALERATPRFAGDWAGSIGQ